MSSGLTQDQAVDEMFQALLGGWSQDYPDLVVRWPNTGDDAPPQGDPPPPWARVRPQHVDSPETAWGGRGQHHHERQGVLQVQLFEPRGGGLAKAYALGETTRTALENVRTPGGVRFTRVRVNEVGPDGAWWQSNVLAEFAYDYFRRAG